MCRLFTILIGLLFLPLNVWGKEVSGIEILRAVEKEFAEQGIANTVELELFSGQTNFEVEDNKDIKILISNLVVDGDNNKFTSDAEIFADGSSVGKSALLGRFFIMKEVYVPLRNIAKDEVIKSEDLKPVLMRENRIKKDSMIDAESIIGKQAVKLLKADKVIAMRDITDELIVRKGQEVLVMYNSKGLQITSKMEAVEDGSKGSFIKFINAKSGKEVRARIIDKNTAEITAE